MKYVRENESVSQTSKLWTTTIMTLVLCITFQTHKV